MAAVDPRALIKDHEKLFKAEELRAVQREATAADDQKAVALAVKAAMTKKNRAEALKRTNDAKRLKKEAEAKEHRRKVAENRKVRINGN